MDNKTIELDIPATAAERLRLARSSEIVAGEGPSSTEYEKWLATRPHLIARLADGTFSKQAGYEIWRSAWLLLRAAYETREARNLIADEVQRRMDLVVDLAVEWHLSGVEGDGTWSDKGEALGAAIDSLLELREKPGTKSAEGGNNPDVTAAGSVQHDHRSKFSNCPACQVLGYVEEDESILPESVSAPELAARAIENIQKAWYSKEEDKQIADGLREAGSRLRAGLIPAPPGEGIKTVLCRFIDEVERDHFRTPYDTGANMNALFIWNLVRRFAGMGRLSREMLMEKAGITREQDAENQRMKAALAATPVDEGEQNQNDQVR